MRSVGVRDVLLSGVVALAVGVGLWQFWWWTGYPATVFTPGLDGYGPDPMAWPRLLAVWVPVAHLLFGLGYAGLGRWDPKATLRRHFLADQAALVLVAVLGAALLALRARGPWRLAIGAWYTLFVGIKTAVFLHGLWRWLQGVPISSRAAGAGVFLGALLPYVLLGGLVTTAMSTTSDEPYYLLVTHSLLVDRDLNLANTFARRDYLPFYWGELSQTPRAVRVTPDGGVYARFYQGLQTLILLPGYAVAGRSGTVVTMNVLAAAALMLVFRLATRIGVSVRAAFLAWLGAAFSSVVVSYAASPFPETSGAFFSTAAVCLLMRERASRPAFLAAALCLAALVAVKTRLFVLVPPLFLGFVRRLRARTLIVAAGTLMAALGLAVAYDAWVFGATVALRLRAGGLFATMAWFLAWTVKAPLEYRGQLGLLFDQEFGLLLTAPVFVLGVAGVAIAAAERRWRLLILTAAPCALAWYYLGAVRLGGITTRGASQWYGGFSPPARFLMAGVPLFAVLIAVAVDRLRGWVGWSFTAGLYALTVLYAAVISAWPAWRFQYGLGRATILLHLFRHFGLDPGRWLPSFMLADTQWVAPTCAVLALTLLAGYRLGRRPGAGPPRGAVPAGILGAVVAVAATVGTAWCVPSGTYPAVMGVGTGGAPFLGVLDVDTGSGPMARERLVWAGQHNGTLELAPHLPPGHYRVVLRAAAQATDGTALVTLWLDSQSAYRVSLPTAAPPSWRESVYGLDVDWGGGRLPIRLDLARVSRQDPVPLVYLDAIEITRR